MKLRVGQSLMSQVDATTVIVVRCPEAEVSVACGGYEMATQAQASPFPAAEAPSGEGLVMGKRYIADELGLELLCVRPGPYSVTADGTVLVQKNAKPLPASD